MGYVYGATSKYNLNNILLKQKEAIRIMYNLKQRDSARLLFTELGILTVYSMYVFKTDKYVKKYGIDLEANSSNHYNTRSHFRVDKHNLELYKN